MTLTSTPTTDLADRARASLDALGAVVPEGSGLTARTALHAETLFDLPVHTAAAVAGAVERAEAAFLAWREVPAPRRGDVVRRFGELLREHKDDLADLVTVETGKIVSEARGEVQEMIDICDYAVGLSRQLWGKSIASERPGHRLAETWHPLGVVGVISAFNFPVAVWAWNTAVALVCGDPVVWKPSELTPLTALGASAILRQAIEEQGYSPDLSQVVLGGREVGEALVDDPRVALLSATGSVRMGREVGPRVAARFGRSLLELGGNNAAIVAPSADLRITVPGVVFAAAGTAGQRCTTLRRLIVHRSVKDEVLRRLVTAYESLPIGDPFADGTLVGPLVDARAGDAFEAAVSKAVAQGGSVLVGGERASVDGLTGTFVRPTIIDMPAQEGIVIEETFAPILYVLTYDDFDEAIALNNGVTQGLSSAVFTQDQREAERFLSAAGSDTGIANVNIGTSGAEIGGAFGGEKETGGGRESGSDSWHAYMRMATNTVNYSTELPLAQGVTFLD
ncbi:putative aldehyde dehydrogenase [Nostocoides japonicum T1-X7]|uniref:aldehyde dehydrogenase (NAD(+)) n=1 Tax=Nostocoides japonicum T1-X7 TaxID=1194083 RepID=A0A077LV19_9MICO|nr:aldehyde dehydrogenase family protein [Tetrasphaera japonica]CCH75869.1 putative aldehyde dehydrogenase [Tetrasphaera japonica T1-X7]